MAVDGVMHASLIKIVRHASIVFSLLSSKSLFQCLIALPTICNMYTRTDLIPITTLNDDELGRHDDAYLCSVASTLLTRQDRVCLQSADIIVATPSTACHISLAKQEPVELAAPETDPWGQEYPYQSVSSAEGGSDPGENFRVIPMQHPILLLEYTSPSSLLLV